MKKVVSIIFLLICIILIRNADADLDSKITKNGISVTLINHTYHCDEMCYSQYKACDVDDYSKLNFKFINDFKIQKEIDKDLKYDEKNDKDKCRIINITGIKGKLENIDNILCFDDVCFDEFEWWNSNYKCRLELNFSQSINDDTIFSVNDTYGLNGDFFWTKKVTEQMYVYFKNVDCSGDRVIGNSTDELTYENATGLSGNNPTDVYNSYYRGFYHLDGKSGSISYDSTQFNNDGSIGSDPIIMNKSICMFGNCLWFNDVNDVVSIPSSSSNNFNQNLTVCVWANFTTLSSGASQSIATKADLTAWSSTAWWLRKNSGSKTLTCQYKKPSVSDEYKVTTGDIIFNVNEWYYICCRINETGNIGIFVNGSEISVTPTGTPTTTWDNSTSEPIRMAQEGRLNSPYMVLDELFIINYALSTDEIMNFYNNGINNISFLGWNETLNVTLNETVTNETYGILNVSVNFNFDMSNSQFIGECIDGNTLLRKWNKTSCIEDINLTDNVTYNCRNAYDFEYLICPYGCIEDIGQYGDACAYPETIMYTILGIFVCIIFLVVGYMIGDKR